MCIRDRINRETCDFLVYAEKEVVPTKDDVEDDCLQIALEDAQEISKRAQVGDMIHVEIKSKEFGRIATQNAKNVILQKIREEERSVIYNQYYEKEKDVVTGVVQRYVGKNISINLGKADAMLTENEQVKGEKFEPTQRVKVYVLEVKNTTKGPKVMVSRTHPELVKRLFESEVSEVAEGIVEIKSIAREAGSRTKMAVWSNDPNVDAVGACVGMNGSRVNAVVNELNGEKIDIITWDENPALLIENALSPAKVISVMADPEEKTAKVIGDLIEKGYQVAVTHSNAPQVGMIHTAMNEFAKEHEDYTAAPMSVCSAMSQGYIGYDLQNAIREELMDRGIYRTVSTILTQVIVDPYDEAFYTPTKVLGRYMDVEEASAERKKGNYVVEEPGKGFRRIVAAPNPVSIVEIDAIKALLDADQVVIACGGGGIPVLEQDHRLKGASAVIEKDLTAGKMAEETDADSLIILTSVEKVKINMDRPEEEELREISVDQAKAYMEEGHFGKYNMYPKFRAAVEFLEKREGRSALITSFDKLDEALKGKTGTLIR